MSRSFALKRLTASDLTLFKWHFENRNAGNQKAINLNADVFADLLFPSIEVASRGMGGRLPLDLWLFGPGAAGPINLQRKIIKGGAYKNWRLNGEFILNPDEQPDRFNVLEPNDFALIAFEGDVMPTAASILLIAQKHEDDRALFAALSAMTSGASSMIALAEEVLRTLAVRTGISPTHPLYALAVSEDLKDAALGSAPATERVMQVARMVSITASDMRRAREVAEDNGRLGEELVDAHLAEVVLSGALTEYEWTSQISAIAPFDFRLTKAATESLIDVKTTSGPFERELHISIPELRVMDQDPREYRIYRVYGVSIDGAKMRVSEPLREFARKIRRGLESLPAGVSADSVSVDPTRLSFGSEIELVPPPSDSVAPV